LPTDFSRPIVQTFCGKRRTRVLPASLTAALKCLSQQEGVTLFMTLLTAFNVLLHRYTGQDDIVVGSPIANRNQADLEPLIGCFVNTLVLRTDLSHNPSIQALLKRVRQVALGAYAHQDVPFEQLVKTLQPDRDPSRTPLFQVMFALQNIPGITGGIEGWEVTTQEINSNYDRSSSSIWQIQEIDTETAKFDLTVFIEERNTELFITLEYNTDLFKDETIDRLFEHFQIILNSIVVKPEQKISELTLLSPQEWNDLSDWNNTKRHIDIFKSEQNREDFCVHEWFEAQVNHTPNETAVLFGEQGLTYRELNQRANQLAHYLRSLGVQPETLVGICLERSLELMVGLIGILKAGGAYVPLDPTYPPERLAFMLTDAQAPILLTQSWLLSTLQSLVTNQPNLTVICLDKDWATIAQGNISQNAIPQNAIPQDNQTNPVHLTTPDNLAYAIYTSGSTGQPKGTLIHHRGLVNYLAWCIRAYPVVQGKGAPVHSSISFDMTITGLFSPLLVGRTVELLPEGFSLEYLSRALNQKTSSVVKVTPAQLKLLSQQVSPQNAANCTQAFIIGGEALTSEHLSFWREAAPHISLINEYGPTETVVGCCTYTVPQNQLISGSISIGCAIDNMQLYILDRYLQPVPIGVPGELYIGGVGLARGYLHRPDLTAERFIPHPFSQEPGNRLYKTGDCARYHSDGTIEFLGRLDHQVKIRGFRIELAEIEGVLGKHPSVQECIVLARDIGSGQQELIAYIVPIASDAETPTIEALRHFLSTQLPNYMIPTRFVLLKAFPLTVNGKVDRPKLPLPDALRPQLEAVYIPPHTELERSIASLWQSTLELDKVGMHDNFFDLGGHSLLLVQIHNQLQTQLQRSIPIIDLFKYPTIHTLAKHLNQGTESSTQFQAVQERAKLQRAAIRQQTIRQQKPLTRDGRKTHG
jgi:amino acid adenylation domain-containing protein